MTAADDSNHNFFEFFCFLPPSIPPSIPPPPPSIPPPSYLLSFFLFWLTLKIALRDHRQPDQKLPVTQLNRGVLERRPAEGMKNAEQCFAWTEIKRFRLICAQTVGWLVYFASPPQCYMRLNRAIQYVGVIQLVWKMPPDLRISKSWFLHHILHFCSVSSLKTRFV